MLQVNCSHLVFLFIYLSKMCNIGTEKCLLLKISSSVLAKFNMEVQSST